MPTAVLEGLALNPAAPADVLIRLIDRHGQSLGSELTCRPLPAPVIDVMLRHPEREVRGGLAGNLDVDLRIRVRMVDDPDPLVVARVRHDRRKPLPADAVGRYLEGFDRVAASGLLNTREARQELCLAMADDRRLVTPAARHANPNVRAAAVFFEHQLSPTDRAALQKDPAQSVRQAFEDRVERATELDELTPEPGFGRWMQLGRPLTREVVDHVLARSDPNDLTVLATNPHVPADAVSALIGHPAPEVRSAIAHRDDLTAGQVAQLLIDPHPVVRNAVSVHPALTEEQRAAIGVDLRYVPGEGDFGPDCEHSGSWRVDPAWTPDEVARWARSSNVLLRRRAARSPELPPTLVPVLAADGDPGVRILLALHSADAPPRLLLGSYLEYTGCGRATLPRKPGFPGAGLARYWRDPDPALRLLVAFDPDAEPSIVDTLRYDPDHDVRQAVAASPQLPPKQIVALLDDPELARAAASNPALPVDVMRQLVN
ncbi:hypothetical protein [Cryptosporangium arvum]|uniref:hypothetical protein n=1 Tax=Cryptosporangium arvum TaxID=80871 RepID=UPI0004B645EC|nr:hypothetical protein [Cryptosporangium arvum]